MSEEEKKLVEKFENLYIKDFNGEPITVDDRLSYIECALMTNLIEKLDKELNSLKEIEQLHQEENGKLRVELEQEKEKNKELEEENTRQQELLGNIHQNYRDKIIKIQEQNKELDEKFKYAVPDEIVDENYVHKDKIREMLEKYEHIPADNPDATVAFYSDIKNLLEENNGK